MKKNTLYYIWGGLYLLCALLGLLPEPAGALAVVMTVLGVAFFAPPAWLLVLARKTGDEKTVKILRLLSILSLSLTVVLFILNIASMASSQTVGNALYYILNFVSVPMICCRYWALSLFLWACLLFCTLPKKKVKQWGTEPR